MRFSVLIGALLVFFGLVYPAASKETTNAPYKGIWVSTPFPSFNAASGQTVTLDLTVRNEGLPPQRVELAVEEPSGQWTAAFIGGGKRVQSVFVAPDSDATVKLRLEPASKPGKGIHRLAVVARTANASFRLPVELSVGEAFPPKLTLKPELPSLKGSPTSDFEFKVAIRNDGGDDATIRVDADTPSGFRVKITEQYGSQELTSLPLKVGEEKTVTAKITPAYSTKQGIYPIALRASSGRAEATTELTMEVTGEPELEISGVGERLSAGAEAGKETPIDVVLTNNGSAPAHNIRLSSTPPSGWKVSFAPSTLDSLAPNERQTVQALVVPAAKAIAGDYMVKVRAESGGNNNSADFRITVHTSTLWGIVGVLVIGAALGVLVVAMLRYGRR